MFKKTLVAGVLSVLAFSGAYAEDSNVTVTSQGGPLGSTTISANDNTSSTATNTSTQQIDQKQLLLQLQSQVQQLQGQINEMKHKANEQSINSGSSNKASANQAFSTYSSKVDRNQGAVSIGGNTHDEENLADIMSNVSDTDSIINLGDGMSSVLNETGAIDVGGAPAITTQGQLTFLGSFSGNNTVPIGQISSNLFASTLLGQRSKFDDYSVFFGGYIEADAQAWGGSNISRAKGDIFQGTGQNIYLTASKLYFLANLGHYVTAQFDFDADETGNFGLGNAFVIFGNLDTSPFFVTAGRNKLSIGTYNGGGPLTSGLTSVFAPDNVTNASVNYKSDSINANIAVFGATDQRADFSAGFFYVDSFTDSLNGGFNIGYIYDLTGAGNTAIKTLLDGAHTGVINVDGNIAYDIGPGNWQFVGGWSGTTNQYDYMQNGTNNLAGAWYVGTNYSLVLGGRDTNFGMAYNQTYNSAGIPMGIAASPLHFGATASGIQYQYILSGQRAYFDNNVLFGPEYAYQKLYNGQHMNTVTLDMSVYI